MLKALIKLILGFIREDRERSFYRGLYIPDEYPRVYGTKIKRRFNNDSK